MKYLIFVSEYILCDATSGTRFYLTIVDAMSANRLHPTGHTHVNLPAATCTWVGPGNEGFRAAWGPAPASKPGFYPAICRYVVNAFCCYISTCI